jgi:hypothetical protein
MKEITTGRIQMNKLSTYRILFSQQNYDRLVYHKELKSFQNNIKGLLRDSNYTNQGKFKVGFYGDSHFINAALGPFAEMKLFKKNQYAFMTSQQAEATLLPPPPSFLEATDLLCLCLPPDTYCSVIDRLPPSYLERSVLVLPFRPDRRTMPRIFPKQDFSPVTMTPLYIYHCNDSKIKDFLTLAMTETLGCFGYDILYRCESRFLQTMASLPPSFFSVLPVESARIIAALRRNQTLRVVVPVVDPRLLAIVRANPEATVPSYLDVTSDTSPWLSMLKNTAEKALQRSSQYLVRELQTLCDHPRAHVYPVDGLDPDEIKQLPQKISAALRLPFKNTTTKHVAASVCDNHTGPIQGIPRASIFDRPEASAKISMLNSVLASMLDTLHYPRPGSSGYRCCSGVTGPQCIVPQINMYNRPLQKAVSGDSPPQMTAMGMIPQYRPSTTMTTAK